MLVISKKIILKITLNKKLININCREILLLCVAILILAVQSISRDSRLESQQKKKKKSRSKTGQDLEGLHSCETNESHTQ